jgi:hypothetical protein
MQLRGLWALILLVGVSLPTPGLIRCFKHELAVSSPAEPSSVRMDMALLGAFHASLLEQIEDSFHN